MGMMNNGFGWGMGYFNPVLPILFTLLIVGLVFYTIYYIIGNTNKKNTASQKADSHALNILKERFARGEIDDEEYERRKNILR